MKSLFRFGFWAPALPIIGLTSAVMALLISDGWLAGGMWFLCGFFIAASICEWKSRKQDEILAGYRELTDELLDKQLAQLKPVNKRPQ